MSQLATQPTAIDIANAMSFSLNKIQKLKCLDTELQTKNGFSEGDFIFMEDDTLRQYPCNIAPSSSSTPLNSDFCTTGKCLVNSETICENNSQERFDNTGKYFARDCTKDDDCKGLDGNNPYTCSKKDKKCIPSHGYLEWKTGFADGKQNKIAIDGIVASSSNTNRIYCKFFIEVKVVKTITNYYKGFTLAIQKNIATILSSTYDKSDATYDYMYFDLDKPAFSASADDIVSLIKLKNGNCTYGNYFLKRWCKFPSTRSKTFENGVTNAPPFFYNDDKSFVNSRCDITHDYCKWMGVEYTNSNSAGMPDCYETEFQKIMEQYFVGKTLFRSFKKGEVPSIIPKPFTNGPVNVEGFSDSSDAMLCVDSTLMEKYVRISDKSLIGDPYLYKIKWKNGTDTIGFVSTDLKTKVPNMLVERGGKIFLKVPFDESNLGKMRMYKICKLNTAFSSLINNIFNVMNIS